MYILACINRENYIGKDGDLLYNIKDDIQGFKEITTDNVIIMGRQTLESLPNGKPLSNRINYVLSKTMKPEINDNLRVFSDVDKLLEDIEKNFKDKDVFCIGGSKIYELFMEKDIVDKLVLTEVDDNTKGEVNKYVKTKNEFNIKTMFAISLVLLLGIICTVGVLTI